MKINGLPRKIAALIILQIFILSCTIFYQEPTQTPTFLPSETPIKFTATPVQKIHYVDNLLGLDTNPGTKDLPWKTIQKAANSVLPGHTVNVMAGNYPEHVTIKKSGAEGAQIIFQTYGHVIMQGFTIRADYVTITGFEITDTPDHPINGWGILVDGSHCLINLNYINYARRGGILLFVDEEKYDENGSCIVRNNRLYRNTYVGIDVRGRNHLVEYNEVWGSIQHHPNVAENPSWADADGIHFHGTGHIIRGNYIHDITFSDPENINPHIDCFQTFFSPPYQEAASNVVLEANYCDNAQAQSPYEVGKGFMLQEASDLIIQNNLVKSFVGIKSDRDTRNLTILNNTFISDLSLPTYFSPAGIDLTNAPDCIIKNNIFFDQPGQIIIQSNSINLDAGKNLASRSDGKMPLTSGTYSHANDFWGIDPFFVSQYDYHLSPDSPAIDAGDPVPVNEDFDGYPRPQGQGWDIGAYEWIPNDN